MIMKKTPSHKKIKNIHPSIHPPSIHPSIYPSIHPSIHPSIQRNLLQIHPRFLRLETTPDDPRASPNISHKQLRSWSSGRLANITGGKPTLLGALRTRRTMSYPKTSPRWCHPRIHMIMTKIHTDMEPGKGQGLRLNTQLETSSIWPLNPTVSQDFSLTSGCCRFLSTLHP